jgi:hypothetical protein
MNLFKNRPRRHAELDWSVLLQQQSLGLHDPKKGFKAAPVSLTPWQLSHQHWQQVQQAAHALGLLLEKIAKDRSWLLRETAALRNSDSVPGAIWRAMKSIDATETRTRQVTLSRHDFILDQQNQWRWVESNPIAAGMGPLNQRWQQLYQLQQPATTLAANPAIETQATLLAEATSEQAGLNSANKNAQVPPILVMVVEAQEDNIYDQQLLAQAIEQQQVSVLRLTFEQLQQCQIDVQHQLRLPDGRIVHLLYWRTGYNPVDHATDAQLAFRAQLEQVNIAQCPTLSAQLTGSKWLQHRLSNLLLDPTQRQQLATHFELKSTELSVLQRLCLPSFAVNELTELRLQALLKQGYWYKKQQEGGGNVARFAQALQWYQQRDYADILMAPIAARIRTEPLPKHLDGQNIQHQGHISELGIFSLGSQATYGGYLCRTKAAQSLEGGVHRGGAVLDLLQLPSSCCLLQRR